MPRVLLYLVDLSDADLDRLRAIAPPPAWRIERVRSGDALFRQLLPEAEVVVGSLSDESLRVAKSLRWLQLSSAGANRHAEHTPAHVALTCARGVHSVPVAEHALALLFALTRDIPAMVRQTAERRWQHASSLDELHQRTFGLLGFGDIGQYLARLLAPFDGEILAFNRTGNSPGAEPVAADEAPGPAVTVFSMTELDAHLPAIDYLLISLPGTPTTNHLIDARRLALMKPTARVVNVGRGSVIDEAALIAALREHRLAGAALDVFETEPLPTDSPLWSLPNVIVSPHVAGVSPRFAERLAALTADNLARYLCGDPLLHVVDRELGY